MGPGKEPVVAPRERLRALLEGELTVMAPSGTGEKGESGVANADMAGEASVRIALGIEGAATGAEEATEVAVASATAAVAEVGVEEAEPMALAGS